LIAKPVTHRRKNRFRLKLPCATYSRVFFNDGANTKIRPENTRKKTPVSPSPTFALD